MTNRFAIWKPVGPTSHDVVNAVRRATGERRVGHGGTLDPLAEGVLVIAVGREATKELSTIVAKEKEYETTITLGATTTTYDAEGEKTKVNVSSPPTQETIESALKKFIGDIKQTPPPFSAIKVSGTPAYKLARAGKNADLKPRSVNIKNIEILSYKWPELTLRVTTGPGVYIRSIAHDLGTALGTGGYISKLTRTRVGEYTRENSTPFVEVLNK